MLIVANDGEYMGEQKNTLGTNIVALIVLAVLSVVTVTAIPLTFLSGSI
jgi:Mn2+/Fe2+ NRAMP family transporter